MPRSCANPTVLHAERGFLDRFAAARAEGFEAVEYVFPYASSKGRLAEALDGNDPVQVLHDLPAENREAGERGIACHPDRIGEFRDGVGRTIEYATASRRSQANCPVGISPGGAGPARVGHTVMDSLACAARRLERAGIEPPVGPADSFVIPCFWPDTPDQAVRGQPGSRRAGHGGDRLPLLVRRTRPGWLPRLDRLRVPSARGHVGWLRPYLRARGTAVARLNGT